MPFIEQVAADPFIIFQLLGTAFGGVLGAPFGTAVGNFLGEIFARGAGLVGDSVYYGPIPWYPS